MRDNPDLQGPISEDFLAVADKVSTPVLLQVHAAFQNTKGCRAVFPKGIVSKVHELPKHNPRSVKGLCTLKLVEGIEDVLVKRFSKLPSLGKTYIGLELLDFLVPFSQRSASKALRIVVRGSKIPFGDKNTIRMFIWWKNVENERTDLDLSAVAFGKDWNNLGNISYFALRDQYGWHSGDIVDAPKGASEFIDIDIAKAIDNGVRYIAMNVNSYTGHQFSEIPEVFAGFMPRENPQSGEIYEPTTVVDRFDLSSKSEHTIPFIFDLVERKVIFVDSSVKVNGYVNNVHTQESKIELVGRVFTEMNKPNLHTLLRLHAKARGTIVSHPDLADTVFSYEAGTPFEIEKIASEYLVD